MRVSEASMREAWLRSLGATQSQLARTQNQISTGLRFSKPSEDPVGAVQSLDLTRALAENSQYSRNADMAGNRLGAEETTLASVGNVLQRLHELAVEANNATQTNDTRSGIASEVREALGTLIQLANTKDGSGNYLFAGFSGLTQPFNLVGGTVVYSGDQGQRQIQIGASRQLADSDSGTAVFQAILNGNGVFSAGANPANTGTGLVGQRTVVDPAQYDGGTYAVNFTSPTAYEVRDAANALVTSGTIQTGQAVVPTIAFRGIQFELTGQPAAGDSFQVAPSRNQDVFTTVQNFISALETPVNTTAGQAQFNNQAGNVLNDLDQAISHVLDVRAQVGSRLNAIDGQKDINSDIDLHTQSLLSQVKDLDYADAISRLNIQLTGLTASEKAFAQTQNLSLFNYL